MALTAGQVQTIILLYKILDVLGLVFVTVVLIVMTVGRQFRIPRFQYVYILFVCIWLLFVISTPSDFSSSSSFCYFYEPWILFFLGAVWLWEVSIAISVFRMVVRSKLKKPSFLNHWMVWTLQTLLTALPATMGFYGQVCSSSTLSPSKWIVFISRVLPLMFYLLIVLVLYAVGGYHLIKRQQSGLDSKTKKVLAFLWLYPVVFWLCWLPLLINRMYSLVTGNVSFALVLIESIAWGLHPILISMIYLLPTAAATWRRLRDSGPCSKQSESEIG